MDLWRESPPGARLAEWWRGRGLDATEIAHELDLTGFTPDEQQAALDCAIARHASRLSAESAWARRAAVILTTGHDCRHRGATVMLLAASDDELAAVRRL